MGILESIKSIFYCHYIDKCEASVVDIEGYVKVKIKKIQS